MKSNLKMIFIIFLLMAFLAGLYVYLSVKYPEPSKPTKEPMENIDSIATTVPSTADIPISTTTFPSSAVVYETTFPISTSATSATTFPTTIPTMTSATSTTTFPTTLPTMTSATSATTFPTTLPTMTSATSATTFPTTLPTMTSATSATTFPTTFPTTRPVTTSATSATTFPTTSPVTTSAISSATFPTTRPITTSATSAATFPTTLPMSDIAVSSTTYPSMLPSSVGTSANIIQNATSPFAPNNASNGAFATQIPNNSTTADGTSGTFFTNPSDVNSSCPNLLIKNGNTLLLYNTNAPKNENNPITFSTLDEYTNYFESQKKSGVTCPVLYLQQESNTQGQDVYRIRPSPYESQGGLPTIANLYTSNANINSYSVNKSGSIANVIDAGRENNPYNSGNYPSFDPQNQYVGVYTTIDQTHDSTMLNRISDNPMDPNWGGVEYTNKAIESGKYEDNNVSIPVLYTPKSVSVYPIQGAFPPPVDRM